MDGFLHVNAGQGARIGVEAAFLAARLRASIEERLVTSARVERGSFRKGEFHRICKEAIADHTVAGQSIVPTLHLALDVGREVCSSIGFEVST